MADAMAAQTERLRWSVTRCQGGRDGMPMAAQAMAAETERATHAKHGRRWMLRRLVTQPWQAEMTAKQAQADAEDGPRWTAKTAQLDVLVGRVANGCQ